MSEPPHASSWVAPPEFYLDENIAGRSVLGALRDLGYAVHTPTKLYGSREVAEGTHDEVWLGDVSQRGWTVVSRDTKILERPSELAAYKAAKLHMVFFPGQATREELVQAVYAVLADICTVSTRAIAGVWRVQRHRSRWVLTEL